MIGRSNLSKGGGSADVVNGIIEQYLAENETIDANTFVEFVNHYTDNSINQSTYTVLVQALKTDTDKILILYDSGNSLPGIRGIVCSISNNRISTTSNITI